MMRLKWSRAAVAILFGVALGAQAILPLAHHLDSASRNPACGRGLQTPALRDSPGSDHHPDSCSICKVLASVELGEAQGLSRVTFAVSSVDFSPAESEVGLARGPVQTGSPPRAPPPPVVSILG
jgi:hypothetical protein